MQRKSSAKPLDDAIDSKGKLELAIALDGQRIPPF